MIVNQPPPYKPTPDEAEAGPSSIPPFQDTPTGTLVDLTDSETISIPGGEEPPPDFTPYEAECFQSGGNTISHDAHLNSDGEALYRFLLSQSMTPPVFQLHCKGDHTETSYRQVNYRHSDGRVHTRSESYTETVLDFDFTIDASQLVGPIHWSVDDADPTYRGAMVREIDSPEGKRKAKRSENKQFKAWVEDRTARGLPPWVSSGAAYAQGMAPNAPVLKSSKTLRQWADIYCASPKYLKEFTYEKVVYGWNIRQLEHAIHAMIVASPYSGNVTVEFTTTSNKIYIRPDNRLSRLLSNKWFKFLTIILILPFLVIWLFKRFHTRGGGTWAVCGGAYALKTWVTEQEPQDISISKSGRSSASADDQGLTPTSSRLVGTKEGEWFRRWQGTIARAVVNRFQSSQPLYSTMEDGSSLQARLLDGY
ncbi:hypothetical protein MIND_00482900 [Mycena indigotica]|uniref:Uncharacterized protein n=1 Tax=Mycena indigotica TaxID=2126181 RepID=A0A8H6SX03_9AGAR|nr:uncharacterized protein MIND_00482900 [Mycena indigotica]KAF7306904.1 hypothetical protein MIND_00482900 [Mycena indigotica]